nr:atherin-like [Anser cygnoides]
MDKAIKLYSVQEKHHPTKDPTSYSSLSARLSSKPQRISEGQDDALKAQLVRVAARARWQRACPGRAGPHRRSLLTNPMPPARTAATPPPYKSDAQRTSHRLHPSPEGSQTHTDNSSTAGGCRVTQHPAHPPHGGQQEDETSSDTLLRSRRSAPRHRPQPSLPSARGPPAIFAPSRSLSRQQHPDMAARQVRGRAGSSLAPSFAPSFLPSAPYLAGPRTAAVLQPAPLFKHLRPAPRTWAAAARGRAEPSRPGARGAAAVVLLLVAAAAAPPPRPRLPRCRAPRPLAGVAPRSTWASPVSPEGRPAALRGVRRVRREATPCQPPRGCELPLT